MAMTDEELLEAARPLRGLESANAFIAEANLNKWQGKKVSELWGHIESKPGLTRPSAMLGVPIAQCATSFILVHDGLYKELGKPRDLCTVLTPLLAHTTLNLHGTSTTDEQGLLRHLRNGFGHCRFQLSPDATTGEPIIDISDYDDRQHRETMRLKCRLILLAEVAERLLIDATNRVIRRANAAKAAAGSGT